MSQVQLFSHPDLGELKATIKNGEPWFLAGDVCRALGIKDSAKAVRDIEAKYKNAGLEVTTSSRTLVQTAGGKQQAVIITEQVLYELIFNSRKQKAVLFRAWVTGERDSLTATQLEHLAMVERVIASALTQGIEKQMNYKDIYRLASSKAKQVYQVVAS